jgi:hypothetical protein
MGSSSLTIKFRSTNGTSNAIQISHLETEAKYAKLSKGVQGRVRKVKSMFFQV